MSDTEQHELDVPLQRGPLGYFFHCPAGSEIEFMELFDSDNGYRITMGFKGAKTFNTMDVEFARQISKLLFNREIKEQRWLSDILQRCVDHTEPKQKAWIAAGRPEKRLMNGA